MSVSIQGVEFYSIKETAELLGLRPEAVRVRIRSGKLIALRVGKEYLVKAEEIKSQLEMRYRGLLPVTLHSGS